MARSKKRKPAKLPPRKEPRIGKLEPRHLFFLNPYDEARFTRCPKCDGKTRIRKRPFGIHTFPNVMLSLNMSGPYCPTCDLIILHQNEVEHLLTVGLMDSHPEVLGNEYLILGTQERSFWRKINKAGADNQEFFENLHDFKKVLTFEPTYYGWIPDK